MATRSAKKARRTVRLGARGRLVLPSEIRQHLGVGPGDEVIMTIQPTGGVQLTSRSEVARRCEGMLTPPPGRDLVAELLAERRAEAEQES